MNTGYPRPQMPGPPPQPVAIQEIAPGVAGACQLCRAIGPAAFAKFERNTGMIFMRRQEHIKGYMCRSCLKKQFHRFFWYTMALGWWGTISFIMNPVLLGGNLMQLRKLKLLPNVPPVVH
jgi:hypothetical protein